jgi:hypothetical protein
MKLSLGITPRDYSVSGGASYDADAQAYFTANTAITSNADKTAINDFYLGLKTDGIYTKLKAMYLPIWGSASSSKWNLVNPQDTNAAFRLSFATGFTFSNSGMTPNGTSAYADTFFIPSSNVAQNSQSYGFYSRTNRADSTAISFGARQTSPATITTTMALRNSNNITSFVNSSSSTNVANTDTRGFFQITRTAVSAGSIVKNSTVTAHTLSSTGNNSYSVYIGARNNIGIASLYDTCECAFFYSADGLTSTEAINFYSRVQTLMTYFGIQV